MLGSAVEACPRDCGGASFPGMGAGGLRLLAFQTGLEDCLSGGWLTQWGRYVVDVDRFMECKGSRRPSFLADPGQIEA